MKVLLTSALAVLFVLAAGVSEASACSCLPPQSVTEVFAASPIVVTARIDSFEELDRTVAGTNVYKTVAAVMTVEKAYKGVVKAGQKMRVLSGGGGDCSFGFDRESIGQQFLFFTDAARKVGSLKGKLYWISTCSRSARIEFAKPDLNFLDHRAQLTGKTRLSGKLRRLTRKPESLANIKVAVSGKNFEKIVETDEFGYFELWDLPAEKYRVAFQVPNGTLISDYKILPLDKTWRRQAPPDNTIDITIAPRKHLDLSAAIESYAGGN
ncbi:MAG: hypothetical protein ABI791_09105 [Acidobacteriota bacterium]